MAGMGTAPVRQRRRPGEVRELLLEGARAVFTEKGYGGASTREIADQAEVSEALLFRHFKTKANLFNEAILAPFNGFMAEFVEAWESQRESPWTDETLTRLFIGQLYDVLSEHRDIALALIAASAHETEVLSDIPNGINLPAMLDKLAAIGAEEADRRGLEDVDIEVAARAIAGMVVALAVLGPWMFRPGRQRPSRDRIIDEVVAIALQGLTRQTASPARP